MIIEAIKVLGVTEFVCDSSGTEESFNATYKSLSESNPSITWDQVQAELQRLQAEYDSNQYQRDRATAYPPIGDQLDMIYHAGLGGDAFQAAISAVKQEYPK